MTAHDDTYDKIRDYPKGDIIMYSFISRKYWNIW